MVPSEEGVVAAVCGEWEWALNASFCAAAAVTRRHSMSRALTYASPTAICTITCVCDHVPAPPSSRAG